MIERQFEAGDVGDNEAAGPTREKELMSNPDFRALLGRTLGETKRIYLKKTGSSEVPQDGLEALRAQAMTRAIKEWGEGRPPGGVDSEAPRVAMSQKAIEAALARQTKELERRAGLSVAGEHVPEEGILVGATPEETAKLILEQERSAARAPRGTDETARRFLEEELGIHTPHKTKEPPKRGGLVGLIKRLRGNN